MERVAGTAELERDGAVYDTAAAIQENTAVLPDYDFDAEEGDGTSVSGISNVIFDRTPVFVFGMISVSTGMVSFGTLMLRTLLCVSAVLILVGVTPFSQLTDQLRRIRVPEFLVTLLEMIYRYIGVLGEEPKALVRGGLGLSAVLGRDFPVISFY